MMRKARLSDARVVAEYNRELALETEGRELDPKVLLEGVRAVLKDSKKGWYFVAEENGTMVGQVLITFEWSDWRNGMFWWLQSVFVPREHRRRGIFGAMFKAIAALAQKKYSACGLRLYMEKDNASARAAYCGMGMKATPYQVFELEFCQGGGRKRILN